MSVLLSVIFSIYCGINMTCTVIEHWKHSLRDKHANEQHNVANICIEPVIKH